MKRIRNSAENPGAIIIDGHGRADLGVIRALGEKGVPIYLLTDKPSSPPAASHYVTRTFPFPSKSASEEFLVSALTDIGRAFDHPPVFFSTGDSSLTLFSRHRAELAPYFRHHLSRADLLEDLYDKVRFATRARAAGLPVPTTIVPRNTTELDEQIGQLHFPVMLKPAEKKFWSPHARVYELTGGNLKGVRVDTPGELRVLFEKLLPFGTQMVIQDYIEGRDEAIYSLHAYVDRDGDLVGSFVGQKLRTYPVHRGIGCFQVSVHEPAVVDVAEKALKALGYTGHAIVQVKRLPGDENRFQIFEINCRYSTWNYLHTFAGVNLPYAAYRDSLGEKQAPLPLQRLGMRWIDGGNDFRAMLQYRRLKEWTWRAWAASYRGNNCYALWDWRDPLPLLKQMTNETRAVMATLFSLRRRSNRASAPVSAEHG